MREILFRGKDTESNKWFYGSYYVTNDTTYCFKEDYDAHPENTKHYILFDEMTDWGLPNRKFRADVITETIGQYTGLTDKNGKKIFEGDIVECFSSDYVGHPKIDTITVKDMTDYNTMVYLNCSNELKVIGNIYDNPELLKAGVK